MVGLALAAAVLSGGVAPAASEPTPRALYQEMLRLSGRYRIPAEVIMAVAQRESGWRQTNGLGGPLVGVSGDIGLMQINPDTARSMRLDLERLRTDWRYNLEAGVRVLNAKWKAAHRFYDARNRRASAVEGEADRQVLENWYYPLNFYNGVGRRNNPDRYRRRGNTYQEKVLDFLRHASAYTDPLHGDPYAAFLPGDVSVRLPWEAVPGWRHGQWFRAGTREVGGVSRPGVWLADGRFFPGPLRRGTMGPPPSRSVQPGVTGRLGGVGGAGSAVR
ncbi:MAG: transglycosylase SLT domain-containing protein [Planctomycetes bacterium]|nr:transglycosylase SLT domain-containing protein [Planctomycetota bacterium]